MLPPDQSTTIRCSGLNKQSKHSVSKTDAMYKSNPGLNCAFILRQYAHENATPLYDNPSIRSTLSNNARTCNFTLRIVHTVRCKRLQLQTEENQFPIGSPAASVTHQLFDVLPLQATSAATPKACSTQSPRTKQGELSTNGWTRREDRRKLLRREGSGSQ
jgi:hypothetical protein